MRSKLNRSEIITYVAYAVKLRELGVDLEIPHEWETTSRAVDIEIEPPPAGTILEVPRGGVVYEVPVRLTSLRSGVILKNCFVSTTWDNEATLEGLEIRGGKVVIGAMEYLRKEVLNERFERSLRFNHRGNIIGGKILAWSCTPIPAAYGNDAIVPVEVVLVDQYGEETVADGALQVSRSMKKASAIRPQHPGLFEPVDDVEVHGVNLPSSKEDRTIPPLTTEGGSKHWSDDDTRGANDMDT